MGIMGDDLGWLKKMWGHAGNRRGKVVLPLLKSVRCGGKKNVQSDTKYISNLSRVARIDA